MEVIYEDSSNAMLIPETEFERSYLKTLDNYNITATIKRGLSAADIVGLRLNKNYKHDIKE